MIMLPGTLWVGIQYLPLRAPRSNLCIDKKELSSATNSNFPIPIFLQPEGVSLRYYKLRLFYLTE